MQKYYETRGKELKLELPPELKNRIKTFCSKRHRTMRGLIIDGVIREIDRIEKAEAREGGEV